MSADLLEVYLVAPLHAGTVGANYSCRQACLYWYASRAARNLSVNLYNTHLVPRKLVSLVDHGPLLHISQHRY